MGQRPGPCLAQNLEDDLRLPQPVPAAPKDGLPRLRVDAALAGLRQEAGVALQEGPLQCAQAVYVCRIEIPRIASLQERSRRYFRARGDAQAAEAAA